MIEHDEKEQIVVLLALGNPSEAVALEKHLNDAFPGLLEIYRAPSGFDAMSLAMNRPRVVLLDQRLPDVMGLDMIQSIREQIGAENYLIFIGGTGKGQMRPGMRDEALKRGASAICDRSSDFEWLTRMIHQLLFPEVPKHPHLHGLELLDLIQMFHQKRCDRTMRVFAYDGRVGSIYMSKGEIIHVEAGGQQGFNAILDLMRWTEGRIVVYDALLSNEKTNTTPTMHLIMDAARMMDEDDSNAAAEPQNALEAMLDVDMEGTPVPVAAHESAPTPAPAANYGEKERRPMNSGDTLSLPALDLDFDLD